MKRIEFSEERRSGCQEGFWEGRKLRGQEGKPVNKTSPRPLREREEFVSERSELTNSGEGLKEGKLFNDSSLNEIPQKPQNDNALSPNSPIALSPLNNKKLDCFANARNDVKNYIVKALSPYSPIALSPLNNKKLDCFANARNDVKNYIVKALSPYSPIALSPLNNKKLDCFAFARNDVKNSIVKALSPYSPIAISPSNKKAAFTLAEVMIVVAIIGVVAALVLPGFMQDMAERINSNRQANIAQKITKSVELMAVNGDYQDIKTTEQFVNKLSKYLKIAKICDNEHLTDCWPTRKIKTAKGDDYNIEDAKTSKDLHTRGSETDNVGVILADGATLIMTFNPDAPDLSAEGGFIPYKKSLPVGGGKFEEFAYSSNATNAIDFVVDVNGKTGPNREDDEEDNYYDIRSFKSARFSQKACPGKKYFGWCLYELGYDYKPYDCVSKPDGDEFCYSTNIINNYWAGASRACAELGLRLPSRAELNQFKNSGIQGFSYEEYVNNYASGAGYEYGLVRERKYLYEPSKVLCIGN